MEFFNIINYTVNINVLINLFLFSQLQSDLLELRDAHAKLRTTNEKLRRDKERFEKERESLKSMAAARRKADFDDDRKINSLLQLVSNYWVVM